MQSRYLAELQATVNYNTNRIFLINFHYFISTKGIVILTT